MTSCLQESNSEENEPKWNIHKCDMDNWKRTTQEIFNNIEFFDHQSIEECYQQFEDKLIYCMETAVPKTTKKIRENYKPCWWNKDVEEKRHDLNKCQRLFKFKNAPTNLSKLMKAEEDFIEAKDNAIDEWSNSICNNINDAKKHQRQMDTVQEVYQKEQ